MQELQPLTSNHQRVRQKEDWISDTKLFFTQSHPLPSGFAAFIQNSDDLTTIQEVIDHYFPDGKKQGTGTCWSLEVLMQHAILNENTELFPYLLKKYGEKTFFGGN